MGLSEALLTDPVLIEIHRVFVYYKKYTSTVVASCVDDAIESGGDYGSLEILSQ
jgi:hypothetical protein